MLESEWPITEHDDIPEREPLPEPIEVVTEVPPPLPEHVADGAQPRRNG